MVVLKFLDGRGPKTYRVSKREAQRREACFKEIARLNYRGKATLVKENHIMAATRKQIVLRLKTDVNSSVRKAAKAQGLSINAYAEKVLGRASGKITSALKVTASK
jgi:hypothetical protein